MKSAVIEHSAKDGYGQFIAVLKSGRLDGAERSIRRLSALIGEESMDDSPFAELDRLKGWLDSFRPLPPAIVAELKARYDVRFTYHSNALEGNTLTQSETALILESGITIGGKTLAEHLEVIGHKDAIDYIEELAGRDAKIGEWEIRQIHSLILKPVDIVTGAADAGRYRTLDVKAAGTGHEYPPHYRVPELMAAFAEWLDSEATLELHPVVRAAEMHYRFVSIHPFRDGNGRTARLLMNLSLLRDGYTPAVLTREKRKEYIEALIYAQANNDDFAPLTALIAQTCRDSLIEYLSVCATSLDSERKGQPFYQEILKALAQ